MHLVTKAVENLKHEKIFTNVDPSDVVRFQSDGRLQINFRSVDASDFSLEDVHATREQKEIRLGLEILRVSFVLDTFYSFL